MTLHGKHLIGGTHACSGSDTFHGVDATTQAILEPAFTEVTSREIETAALGAETAFRTFSHTSGEERAAFLEAIATEIEVLGDDLLQRGHQETGLPLARLTGERGRTCAQLRLFAGVARDGNWVDARIDPALPDRKPLPRPDVRRMLRPIGPVAVFGASNFPLAFSVAGGDTASALATGNTVVVKAHPAHPGTSELVAEAIVKAAAHCKLPPGVFSLVHGRRPETSIALVSHAAIQAVGFTGSHKAGRALFDAACARSHPIPVFAEMSSINPVFVLPAALRATGAAIAEGLKNSFSLGVGQFCTKPGVVFGIASPEWEAFIDTFVTRAKTVPKGTMLHAGIATTFASSLRELDQVNWLERGAVAVARITSAQYRSAPSLARERFGPFTLLVTVATFEEMTSLAANLEGQLTATIHAVGADMNLATPLVNLLERSAGRVLINGFPTGVEVCHAMNHGGPYPASTDSRFTSVGTAALLRFTRPVCFQDFPDSLRPDALKDANPLGLLRLVDGSPTREAVRSV
ncbi:MAG: aldehyde dehydrogenase (NADP(+)) [Opitutaceae bacterium]|nr:aldehyde dehydrogenase (NADP(+)) [Opitutaceae bacterium]